MLNSKTNYTLELIAQRKAEKEALLEKSKDNISTLAQGIINPPQTKNNAELWMHYASNGMMAYNGIMTCAQLYKRIKGTFNKKKKKKRFFSWL